VSAPRIVVVGAGPAGVRAAEAFVARGLRPVVIDEAPASGGQIYRRPPPGFTRPARALYGFEAARARRLHAAFDALAGAVEYRPDTLAWNVAGGRAHVVHDGRHEAIAYDRLIIASGACDRVLPFPGWTLPGVFSLGGAQIALKHQGCAIGERVAFVGSGPLLYLVAWQYAKAGAGVALVLDGASSAARRRMLAALPAAPARIAKGVWYLAGLRARGIPVISGARAVAARGDGRVTTLVWRDGKGRERETACDAIATGHGLVPETRLAEIAGCPLAFDPGTRDWLPVTDGDGRTPVEGLYLAGDGAGIAGADAAEVAGELAALALLADCGFAVDRARLARLRRERARLDRFRRTMERAFPYPGDLAAALPDAALLCRCEAITAGALRAAASEADAGEINRAKALTRVGMGRCQGRLCGPAAREILAAARGVDLARVGRLRAQAPARPVPFATEPQAEAGS